MTDAPVLLDTCVLIWMTEGKLSEDVIQLIDEAAVGLGVYVSPISAWELGMLIAKGRIALKRDPATLIREMTHTRLRLAPMDLEILIASSFLPHCGLRDPADRILAATARANHWRLLTQDRPLLDYAADGWMQAVAC